MSVSSGQMEVTDEVADEVANEVADGLADEVTHGGQHGILDTPHPTPRIPLSVRWLVRHVFYTI